MEVYFITSNRHKLEEVRKILDMNIKSRSIELDEIQGIDAATVAIDKAKRAYAITRKPVIVEDTALYINALKGFPGALIKFMVLTVGCTDICRMLRPYKDREATAEACIVFYDGKVLKRFSGRVDGYMSYTVRGRDGFGFDSVFIPRGQSKTFAEMGEDEKNRISHRMKAVLKLKRYMRGRLA